MSVTTGAKIMTESEKNKESPFIERWIHPDHCANYDTDTVVIRDGQQVVERGYVGITCFRCGKAGVSESNPIVKLYEVRER